MIGLTYDLVPCQGIRSVLCASQPIFIIVLAARPLALLSKNHALRRRLPQMETNAGVCFQPTLEAADINTLRSFVMSGQSISLLPHSAMRRQAEASVLRTIPLDNMPLCVTTHVVARVQRRMDPMLESLLGMLVDHHPTLQPPVDSVTRLSA